MLISLFTTIAQLCVLSRILLTPQEAFTLFETDGVRVTLLGGGGAVALRHGHDGGSVPHQELTQVAVVARGGAVQRRPGGGKSPELDETNTWRIDARCYRAGLKRGSLSQKRGAYQPWLSGALTLAPERTRKSTTL